MFGQSRRLMWWAGGQCKSPPQPPRSCTAGIQSGTYHYQNFPHSKYYMPRNDDTNNKTERFQIDVDVVFSNSINRGMQQTTSSILNGADG